MAKKEKKEPPPTFLYSLRVGLQEHAAAQKLIEVLETKGKIKPGDKGKVSRQQLIRYLVYCALDIYEDEIFTKTSNKMEAPQQDQLEIETKV